MGARTTRAPPSAATAIFATSSDEQVKAIKHAFKSRTASPLTASSRATSSAPSTIHCAMRCSRGAALRCGRAGSAPAAHVRTRLGSQEQQGSSSRRRRGGEAAEQQQRSSNNSRVRAASGLPARWLSARARTPLLRRRGRRRRAASRRRRSCCCSSQMARERRPGYGEDKPLGGSPPQEPHRAPLRERQPPYRPDRMPIIGGHATKQRSSTSPMVECPDSTPEPERRTRRCGMAGGDAAVRLAAGKGAAATPSFAPVELSDPRGRAAKQQRGRTDAWGGPPRTSPLGRGASRRGAAALLPSGRARPLLGPPFVCRPLRGGPRPSARGGIGTMRSCASRRPLAAG